MSFNFNVMIFNLIKYTVYTERIIHKDIIQKCVIIIISVAAQTNQYLLGVFMNAKRWKNYRH